jgi:hypothetical protein
MTQDNFLDLVSYVTLAFPLPELPVGGTSLEPFKSALYFTLAAMDVAAGDISIPAATVKSRAVRMIVSRIAMLQPKMFPANGKMECMWNCSND